MEEYDDTYWTPFRELEREARDQLVDGQRHLYEAEMKERERSAGDPHHTAVPTTPAAGQPRADPESG